MDVVLGVSMTPTAVRMVLVQGRKADGITVDHQTIDIGPGQSATGAGMANRVVDAILGTRESAAEGGHRVVCTGVVWSAHAAAAELRGALRSRGLSEVTLVSELHAAGALAQAIGATTGYRRTALMFVDGDTATLAVVRTDDGAVVLVHTRSIPLTGRSEFLHAMVGRLDLLDVPPEALFIVGTGADAAELTAMVAEHTGLPVHAPDDADLALARGAALASATTPRYEAATVGLAPDDDTQVAMGNTERASAEYMAPLAYSSAFDENDSSENDADESAADEPSDPEDSRDIDREPFLLTGSALAALFVVGMASLLISLVVTIRPAAQQQPDTGPVTNSQAPAPEAAGGVTFGSAAPETIQAPIPVVREAPRTVYVAPAAPAAVAPPIAPAPAAVPPAPAAPAPAPEAVPAPEAPPAPAAPAPDVPAKVVPVPVPIVVPVVPPLFPQLPAGPFRRLPRESSASSAPAPTSTPPQTPEPAPTSAPAAPQPPAQASTPAPAADSGGQSAPKGESSSAPTESASTQPAQKGSQSPLWPLWPFGH